MLVYAIEFKPSAKKEFDKLERRQKRRIALKIDRLSETSEPNGERKLKIHMNRWRISVGEYRMVYQVFDDMLLVLILRVRHRSEVYRWNIL